MPPQGSWFCGMADDRFLQASSSDNQASLSGRDMFNSRPEDAFSSLSSHQLAILSQLQPPNLYPLATQQQPSLLDAMFPPPLPYPPYLGFANKQQQQQQQQQQQHQHHQQQQQQQQQHQHQQQQQQHLLLQQQLIELDERQKAKRLQHQLQAKQIAASSPGDLLARYAAATATQSADSASRQQQVPPLPSRNFVSLEAGGGQAGRTDEGMMGTGVGMHSAMDTTTQLLLQHYQAAAAAAAEHSQSKELQLFPDARARIPAAMAMGMGLGLAGSQAGASPLAQGAFLPTGAELQGVDHTGPSAFAHERPRVRKRHTAISVADKEIIIRLKEQQPARTNQEVADLFNAYKAVRGEPTDIKHNSVAVILQNKHKWLDLASDERKVGRLRMREAKYPDLEEAIYVWYKQLRDQGQRPSSAMVKAKARELQVQLGIPDTFQASQGWLQRFKQRRLGSPIASSVPKESAEKTAAAISNITAAAAAAAAASAAAAGSMNVSAPTGPVGAAVASHIASLSKSSLT